MEYPALTELDGHSIKGLVAAYGSPLYLYSRETIRERVGRMLACTEGLPIKLFYAVKANTNPYFIRLLLSLGVYGCQTVSLEQVQICLRCGCPPERIFHTANYALEDELREAIRLGVVLNLGERQQLHDCRELLSGQRVFLRVNTLVGDGHCDKTITNSPYSKFGIPIGELKEVALMCKEAGIVVVGLHQHMGSNYLTDQKLVHNFELMLSLCKDLRASFGEEFKYLNYGGGIGVPYRPVESPFNLDAFFKVLGKVLAEFREKEFKIQLYSEPGRYFIAEAGHLICTVATTKHCHGTNWVGVDSGMNHLLRPALYQSYHGIRLCSQGESEQQETVHVCGNICESGDVLGKARTLRKVRAGDLLSVENVGAYGFCMSSNYNSRCRPAQVVVGAGFTKLIRKRESLEDQLALVEQFSLSN